MNIGTLITRHARYRPDHLAVVFEDNRLTYKELNRLANALLDMGLTKSDKIATILPNCLEMIEIYVTILDKEDYAAKPDSVGTPPPFFEMRIMNEKGEDLPPGEVGEIVGLQNVVIMDDFPRSVAGKTLKRVMRQPYWAEKDTKI